MKQVIERIPTFSTQLKILTTVKATMLGSQGKARHCSHNGYGMIGLSVKRLQLTTLALVQYTNPLGSAHGARVSNGACVSKNTRASPMPFCNHSAVRAKHTRTHVRLYSVGLLVVQWVVIGHYVMGRILMDRSIPS